jgi:hypothetical protein
MTDLEIDHVGVPTPGAAALLGERRQLDVVVDGNRKAQVLRHGLHDRQADQFGQRETGAQVTVRLDHPGQSQADRTKPRDVDRALLRRDLDRARDQGNSSAPVPLQFCVADPAAGQVADDGSRPARAKVHAGHQPGLPANRKARAGRPGPTVAASVDTTRPASRRSSRTACTVGRDSPVSALMAPTVCASSVSARKRRQAL